MQINESNHSPFPRVRILCLPDVERAIGGVKQLYRHVEHLSALGWDAAILTENPGFRPGWFESTASTISLAESYAQGELDPLHTILVLPETYLGVDLACFRDIDLSSLPRVVFNQNAYYSYGHLGDRTAAALASFYEDPSVLHVLSISEDTHDFLSQNLSLQDNRLSRIVNSIEPIFAPCGSKESRIHWMPRKNPDHVQAVLLGLQHSSLNLLHGWQGQPLAGLSHVEVAENLNRAKIFLAFGHPEGFGLPIAEAMAAGCWVIGYTGMGGRELFRYGASDPVSFGDWSGFITSIQKAIQAFTDRPRETSLKLQRQSLAVRTLYSLDQERDSISLAWKRISIAFNQWRERSIAD
jgi:hypothetical protein